jgi:hypothetical protein
VLRAHQCPRPEAAPAGPGGMPACTHKHVNPRSSHLLTETRSLFAHKKLCSKVVQRNRVFERLGVQPRGQGASDGEGLAGWLAQYIPPHCPPLAPSLQFPTIPTPHYPHHTSLSSPFQLLSSCQAFENDQDISEHLILMVKSAHHPVAMSSSPKAPSSTRQAARLSNQSSSDDQLHQTVYDDGRNRCIVESRRRSKTARNVDTDHLGRSRVWSKPASKVMASPERVQPGGSLNPSSTVSSSKSDGLAPSRDGYSKPSFSKPRTVVIVAQTPNSTNPKFYDKISTSQNWLEPTPPPTPRLGRLPSPELSDLEETPFCECDEITRRRYCNSCKKEVDSSVKHI